MFKKKGEVSPVGYGLYVEFFFGGASLCASLEYLGTQIPAKPKALIFKQFPLPKHSMYDVFTY